ncbi:hypothetical protein ACFWNK_30800 [Streptomyces sp. NPDC058417]|uniref:hypothetical protein n=1 Tax=unclassified Streptomyces TaxID=2593676 RepID=UPI0036631CD0
MSAHRPVEPKAEDGSPPPIAYPETGETRVLSRKCDTCVLNPAATAAQLTPGRRKALVEEVRDDDGHVVCHSTLPPAVPRDSPAAMCRGFVDAYGLATAVAEAVADFGAHILEFDPPQKELPHSAHRRMIP